MEVSHGAHLRPRHHTGGVGKVKVTAVLAFVDSPHLTISELPHSAHVWWRHWHGLIGWKLSDGPHI